MKLDELRVPNEDEARERAWQVVRTAYETRQPVLWPRRHARPLLAAAVVAAVVAAALSPPGRSVIHSLRKAVGVQNAQPELFSLPAPGQLLVTSRGGAWIVHSDGSRRRLGAYRDATWSPHGLFVAATRKNELLALDPQGHVRWSLARRSARLPSWGGTRTDTRIAYLSGGKLRVVAGDGTGDQAIGAAAPIAPAWRPGPERVLAYAASRGGAVVRRPRHGIGPAPNTPGDRDQALLVGRRAPAARLRPVRVARLRRAGARRAGRKSFRCDPRHRRGLRSRHTPGHVHPFARAPERRLQRSRRAARLSRNRRVRPARLLSQRPLAARHLADREPVGVRRERPSQDRRRCAQIARQFGGFPRIEGWCCGS